MNILLTVTGSISAYKSLDLTRELTKAGHQLKIILTKGAEHFVLPQVFKYLGAQEVFHSQSDFEFPNLETSRENKTSPVLHVNLGNWADIFVVAPLSANSLARICQGAASDLFSSTFLALKKKTPILFFPAMNEQMLEHPFVQKNFSSLKHLFSHQQIFIHPTRSGELICQEEGRGKLPEVDLIKDFIESFPLNSSLIQHKQDEESESNILISTGATIAPLDPVRYLTNASSGITGFHLAKYALSKGRKVRVIAGKNSTQKLNHLEAHPHFELIRVITTGEMKREVLNSIKEYPNYISSAAIGDFSFDISHEKIKKETLPSQIPLKREDDILKAVIDSKSYKKIVGFAAESNLTIQLLKEKYKKKPVHLLIGTKVNNGLIGQAKREGFENLYAEYLIMNSNQEVTQLSLSKVKLAEMIIDHILEEAD